MEQSSHISKVAGKTGRLLAADTIIDGTVIGTELRLLDRRTASG